MQKSAKNNVSYRRVFSGLFRTCPCLSPRLEKVKSFLMKYELNYNPKNSSC
jgi:hypothetical protein